jgi:hypothetical protein
MRGIVFPAVGIGVVGLALYLVRGAERCNSSTLYAESSLLNCCA